MNIHGVAFLVRKDITSIKKIRKRNVRIAQANARLVLHPMKAHVKAVLQGISFNKRQLPAYLIVLNTSLGISLILCILSVIIVTRPAVIVIAVSTISVLHAELDIYMTQN